MRRKPRKTDDENDGFIAFDPIDDAQVILIVIAGIWTCLGPWVAASAWIYGALASSSAALGVAEIALETSAVTAIGTICLTWAYRFARQPRPSSPKS